MVEKYICSQYTASNAKKSEHEVVSCQVGGAVEAGALTGNVSLSTAHDISPLRTVTTR